MIKRICINARFLTQKLTGVQRFASEISKELRMLYSKEELIFVCPHNIIHKELAKELGVKIIGKHTGHLWEQIDLPIYLKNRGNPLLICLANTAPIFYQNKISTIHDVAFKVYPETFSKKFLYSYLFIIPRILKTSKHILTVSNFSKKEIYKYYHTDLNKISVVYNAVKDEFTNQNDYELNKYPYFLAVSSVNYRKNFLAVLKAFELFKDRVKGDYKLYVIGDLNSYSFNRIDLSSYKNNSDIIFLGRVSDEELVRYYSNAISFLYPSLYEGFGIPTLEAQACLCPVLCSSIEPLKEVLSDSALYANPYSVGDIASKMGMLTHPELRNKLIQLGKENLKRFSWDVSATQLMKIVDRFI